MRVAVNAGYCEHSGECIALVPSVFSTDEDGRTSAIDGEIPVELEDEIRVAVDFCPRLAVVVTH
jgi:ferredoxin